MSAKEERKTRAVGRPRSSQAHDAIIKATLSLFGEVGFDNLSIEAVAERAGTGKTTIYRRWPGKEALILDALKELEATATIEETGNLKQDLRLVVGKALEFTRDNTVQKLLPRLVGMVSTNPRLLETYFQRILQPTFKQFNELFDRAKARGELRAEVDTELLVEVIAGSLILKSLQTAHTDAVQLSQNLYELLWFGIQPLVNCPAQVEEH